MNKYENGKIYTIRNKNDPSLIYVGSTIQSLCNKFSNHKAISKRKPKTSFYEKVRDWNDWYIELYEEIKCQNKEQLLKREGEVIRKISTLNRRIENRSKKEYSQDNKEHIKEVKKVYIEKNQDVISTYQALYREKHREKHKQYMKEYYMKKKKVCV